MSFLPPTSLDLHGGCFCGAIRYTLHVPALEDRPLLPNMLKTPVGSERTVDTRWPTIELDHCDSCRHAAGAIIQCFLICPAPWISWSLLKRSANTRPAQAPLPASRDEQSGEGREAFSAIDIGYPAGSKKQEALADTYLSSFSTSETVHRGFCGRCGTNLTYWYEREPSNESNHIDITVGSLDTSSLCVAGVTPDRHGWWGDGVEWVQKLLFEGDRNLIRHPEGNMAFKV